MGRVLAAKDRLDVLCVSCMRNLPLPDATGLVTCDCGIVYSWALVHSALPGEQNRQQWKAILRRDGYRIKIEIVNGQKTAIVEQAVRG